jgi:hypothetical protein
MQMSVRQRNSGGLFIGISNRQGSLRKVGTVSARGRAFSPFLGRLGLDSVQHYS